MSKPCIIFNPTARGGKAKNFRESLSHFAKGCLLYPTQCAGMARALAAKAALEGCDPIVAAGGDGTLNEVINGLADHPQLLSTTRLGIIPMGTVNVFAKELGIPTNTEAAWQVINGGREKRLDLPHVQWQQDQTTHLRYFIQLAGAGLDSRAIEKVSWTLKQKVGPLAYIFAGMKAMAGHQPRVRVMMDSGNAEGELVLVGNGRFYGGKFLLFPEALLDDGKLDVCVFDKVNLPTVVRTGVRFVTGQEGSQKGVRHFQTNRLRLECDQPLWLELEGDNVCRLPVEIGMSGKQVRVLVP